MTLKCGARWNLTPHFKASYRGLKPYDWKLENEVADKFCPIA